jgi:hypothetical protein
MKKTLIITTLLLLFANVKSFAQTINLSPDSVTTLLCKKWEVTHVVLDGKKMEKPSDMGNVTYQFNKDKTLSLIDEHEIIKGIWQYDLKQKSIKLLLHKELNSVVVSLTKTELVILAAPENATPSSEKLMLICRVKKG